MAVPVHLRTTRGSATRQPWPLSSVHGGRSASRLRRAPPSSTFRWWSSAAALPSRGSCCSHHCVLLLLSTLASSSCGSCVLCPPRWAKTRGLLAPPHLC